MDTPNVARHAIAKFGGQAVLAKALGKGPSTVQHWAKTGIIPAKWNDAVLRAARERGIDLAPGDLVEPPVQVVVSTDEGLATLPVARWPGFLPIGDTDLPVYVFDDGRHLISRTGAASILAGRDVGGKLENYLVTEAIRPYLPPDIMDQMIEFTMPGVVNKTVQGVTAETFVDICRAYVQARNEGAHLTSTQLSISVRSGMFLAACAKVGLIALIDEATGAQYERAEDALRLKLKMYLEDEMRKWEKTFPDELWKEFGRLTRWQGVLHERPKYWGKLVLELIYDYLDPDVADWLKKNNPQPSKGRNYHQWLSSQYGLRKLIEHLWMVIGMASACQSIAELRRKMAEKYGRVPVQYTMYLPSAASESMLPNSPRRRASPGTNQKRKQPALPMPEPEPA